VLKTRLPCLITMLEASNEMRRGSLPDVLRAERAEITTWNAEAAGVEDLGKCGMKGSPTKVNKVFAPQPRAEKAKMITADDSSPAGLAAAAVETVLAEDAGLLKVMAQQSTSA